MRKVTQDIVRAFYNGEEKTIRNSQVQIMYNASGAFTCLNLHRNRIAKIENNELWICNGGWSSMTTKERLNGLRGVNIVQHKGVWYLNGTEWDGAWVKIS